MNTTNFQLDIQKPGYKIEVFHCILSGIKTCHDWKIELPTELKSFCESNNPDPGYNWENELLKQVDTMPIELLKQWVASLRQSMCRAEMRAILKTRSTIP